MSPHTVEYHEVPGDQEPKKRPTSRRERLGRAVILVAVILAAAAGFGAGICLSVTEADCNNSTRESLGQISRQNPSTKPTNAQYGIQDCGESPAEARLKGCKFEVMLQMWIPSSCYDKEHSEFFLRKGRWKWYYDSSRETEMPDEVMRKGEHEISFMTEDYHRNHCAYAWEFQMRAMREKRPLIHEPMSYKHAHHCNNVLLNGPPPSRNSSRPVGVETHSGYGRCASYESWLENWPEEE